MTEQPLLFDWYCCHGGTSVGYQRAGFQVVGADLFVKYSQKRYPFPSIKGDALALLGNLLDGRAVRLNDGRWIKATDVDVWAGSPPCQLWSITNAARQHAYPDLLQPTREAFQATGKPYVIENVERAPLQDPVRLCWTGFHQPGSVLDDDGTPLQMFRHRLFESNVPLTSPGCRHDPQMQVAGSYGGARRDKHEARHVRHGGYVPSRHVQQALLGIDWATEGAMHQAIPPVYTQHLGHQLLQVL